MNQDASTWVLLVSTLTIGLVHSLAPDHWVPFVSIGRARKWSRTKLVWVTLLSGLAHVGSSIAIGCIGLALGFSLARLDVFESQRAQVAGLLLIGFGLAYGIWGLKRAHKHGHHRPRYSVTVWALILVFLLGPCEPLIPMMFVSAVHGWAATLLVTVLFLVVTLVMMVVQVLVAYQGVGLFNFAKIEHYGDAIAGMVIFVTGAAVMFMGI